MRTPHLTNYHLLTALLLAGASLLVSCRSAPPAPPSAPAAITAPEESALTRSINQLINDLERCRLMVGICADLCQDINCFNVYTSGEPGLPGQISAREMEVLALYERLAPLDYAASSLKMADNCGELRDIHACLEIVKQEIGGVAAAILQTYRHLQAEAVSHRTRITGKTSNPVPDVFLAETHWDDPVREKQRQLGVNIGWQVDFSAHSPLALARLLAKASDMGVTFITPVNSLISWENTEIRPGVYDFSALEEALRATQRANLRLRLPLSLVRGGVPAWFHERNPGCVLQLSGASRRLAADKQASGNRLRPINLFDPATRDAYRDMLMAASRFCRQKGYSQNLLTISLELPGDAVAWQEIMNGTRPRYVGSYYELAAEVVREVFPGIMSDLQIMEYLDAGSGEESAPLHAIDLLRSVDIATSRGDAPLIHALTAEANHYSSVGRTGAPAAGAPYDLATSSLTLGIPDSASLARCMLNGQIWRENTAGIDAALRPEIPGPTATGMRTIRWDAALSSFLTLRRIHRVSPYLLNTKISKPEIALFVPSLGSQPEGYSPMTEAAGWSWALGILGIPFETWGESALNGGLPARIKTLILPQCIHLSDAHVKIIQEFVLNGGTLICVFAPGSGYGPYPLANLAGCRPAVSKGEFIRVSQQGVSGTWLQLSMPYETWTTGAELPEPDCGYPRTWQERQGRDVPWQMLQLQPGSSVLANYTSGAPAIVAYTRFKGKVYTLGYPFGVELGIAAGPIIRSGFVSAQMGQNQQVLGMLAWLKDFLASAGVEAPARVSRWRYASVPALDSGTGTCLDFPKSVCKSVPLTIPTATVEGVESHCLRFSWFSSPDGKCHYLGVANMAAPEATGREAVYKRVLPRFFRITLPKNQAASVVDMCRDFPVRLVRDTRGLHFWTALAPGDFSIFSLSPGTTAERYAPGVFPGLSPGTLAVRLEQLTRDSPELPSTVLMPDPASVSEWFTAHAERDLFVNPGLPQMRPAAMDLTAAIKDVYGNFCRPAEEDGQLVALDDGRYGFTPSHAQILIGNEWTTHDIAHFANSAEPVAGDGPALLKNVFSATPDWPGPGRAVVTLTRRKYMYPGSTPVDCEVEDDFACRQRLLVLASDADGIRAAAQAIRALTWQAPALQPYDSAVLASPHIRKTLADWRSRGQTGGVLPADKLPDWFPKVDNVSVEDILEPGIRNCADSPPMSYYVSSPTSAPESAAQPPVILAYHRLAGNISAVVVATTHDSDDSGPPDKLYLEIGRRIKARGAFTYSPFTGQAGLARIIARSARGTTLVTELTNHPLLLLFPSED